MSITKFFRSILTRSSEELEIQAMPQLKVCKDEKNFRTSEMVAIPDTRSAGSTDYNPDFGVTSEQWSRVTSELVDLNLESQQPQSNQNLANFQFDPRLDELDNDFFTDPTNNNNTSTSKNINKNSNNKRSDKNLNQYTSNNTNKNSNHKHTKTSNSNEQIGENHSLLSTLFSIPNDILNLISKTDALHWRALPLKLEGVTLTVLYSSEPVKPLLIQHFTNKCPEYTVDFQLAPWSVLSEAITHHYLNIDSEIAGIEDEERLEEHRLHISQIESEIELPLGIKFEHGQKIDETNLFNTILTDAFCKVHSKRGTDCDIDLEYETLSNGNVKTYLVIRARIDRQMVELARCEMLPATYVKLMTVLKTLANIDTSSYHNAITGTIRAELVYGAKLASIEMRCNITPTNIDRCSSVSIRFQYKSDFIPTLDNIGLLPEQKKLMVMISRFCDGLVIFSGPINSGKQTTQHAMLEEGRVHRPNKKIVSLEDPIEFRMKGVVQIAVQPGVMGSDGEEHGYVYFLKSALRSNIDILSIGETRDSETAQIIIDAADSGCIVYSTFHAANANKVVERLMDFVKQPSRLADSVKAIINQKLIRKNCDHCEKVVDTDLPEIPRLDEYIQRTSYKGKIQFMKSTGKLKDGSFCKKCHGTGLRGLVGVFEILLLSQKLRQLILQRIPASEIRTEAIRSFGFKTLWINGLTRALMGDISLFELVDQVGVPIHPEDEGLPFCAPYEELDSLN